MPDEHAGSLTANPGVHNQNFVCYPINTMVALRGGKDDMRTCFGVGEPDDPQFTLSAAQHHAVCYAIDALSSNSMKSPNPHSGFHETKMVKCLDTTCLNPSCNQGGVCVCRKLTP